MRPLFLSLLLLVPALAFGQGVSRVRPAPEVLLWTTGSPSTNSMSSAQVLGGRALPASHAFVIQHVGMRVVVVSGGGAGSSVVTLTDGTNTCTATFACTGSGLTATGDAGAKRVATANGAGSGCAFPAGARITASVTTAGCTTTQPSFTNMDFIGNWL